MIKTVGSLDDGVGQGYLDNSNDQGNGARGVHGLSNNCRNSMPPLSRLTRGFRHEYH